MELKGLLMDLPWSKLLRIIEQSQLPGLLTIQVNQSYPYLIGIEGECIVSVARKLNNQGLLWLIHAQGEICFYTANRLARTCPRGSSLGGYLKSQAVLSSAHLQDLFRCQVISVLYPLIQKNEGYFQFQSQLSMSNLEMTGLKLPIYDLWMASLSISQTLSTEPQTYSTHLL
ncbi:MAG: DUF4388 domain-containing protein [Cyanobacteria bacterium P01_F01_bin.150]